MNNLLVYGGQDQLFSLAQLHWFAYWPISTLNGRFLRYMLFQSPFMYSLNDIDRIYFSQTKTYFEEVLSSYFNGNYRSAIVMLYSTVVCDLMLKLNELSNLYCDNNATKLLNDIQSSKSGTGRNKSEWEQKLVEEMYQRGYISDKLKSDISSLYNDRCFSAHPSMNVSFELISPSKEVALGHIRNMLDGLFVEPPMFNKNMLDWITTDLEGRKGILVSFQQIRNYVVSSYYSRMRPSVKASLFKSLWNFCFNKPNDPKCQENAEINRMALEALCDFKSEFGDAVNNGDFKFKFANEGWCMNNLCIFFSNVGFYEKIDSADQSFVEAYLRDHLNVAINSWYKFGDFDRFLSYLNDLYIANPLSISTEALNRLGEKCSLENRKDAFISFIIGCFDAVYDFYAVFPLYQRFIEPYLSLFQTNHLHSLLKKCNGNQAIYNCFAFRSTICSLFKRYETYSGSETMKDEFPNLFVN